MEHLLAHPTLLQKGFTHDKPMAAQKYIPFQQPPHRTKLKNASIQLTDHTLRDPGHPQPLGGHGAVHILLYYSCQRKVS